MKTFYLWAWVITTGLASALLVSWAYTGDTTFLWSALLNIFAAIVNATSYHNEKRD